MYYEARYNNQYQALQDTFRRQANRDHIEYTGYPIEDRADIERAYFVERCGENYLTPLFN